MSTRHAPPPARPAPAFSGLVGVLVTLTLRDGDGTVAGLALGGAHLRVAVRAWTVGCVPLDPDLDPEAAGPVWEVAGDGADAAALRLLDAIAAWAAGGGAIGRTAGATPREGDESAPGRDA